jgi:hypothetical protein
MGRQMMLWILQPNGLADRCCVPYNLETMSCIVGHIVMWNVMPQVHSTFRKYCSGTFSHVFILGWDVWYLHLFINILVDTL